LEFAKIMKEEGLNQWQLARKLGISRVRITQILNLLKLPQEQQDYVLEHGKKRNDN
jgi:DNA-binding transcriptional regulator LsrR (DeoR family)